MDGTEEGIRESKSKTIQGTQTEQREEADLGKSNPATGTSGAGFGVHVTRRQKKRRARLEKYLKIHFLKTSPTEQRQASTQEAK